MGRKIGGSCSPRDERAGAGRGGAGHPGSAVLVVRRRDGGRVVARQGGGAGGGARGEPRRWRPRLRRTQGLTDAHERRAPWPTATACPQIG